MLTDCRFRAAWWLASPHAQTTYPTFARRRLAVPLERERVELPDGDFIDLDRTLESHPSGPLVLILHGLEGSSRSRYVQGMLQALQHRGWQGVVINFRGCSGTPNRLPRGYHSGDTGDLRFVIDRLRARQPQRKLITIGYSLGGSVLLKYLGERPDDNGVNVAVAVSVPFVLSACVERLNSGYSKFYQHYLLASLKHKIWVKSRHIKTPVNIKQVLACRSLKDFDDCVTAPLHGFQNADDYYSRCSSRQFLSAIRQPTLILHAEDDPFMTPAVLPTLEELSPHVTLEVSVKGGHVGFVGCDRRGLPRYWLEERIPCFISSQLQRQETTKTASTEALKEPACALQV